MVTMQKKWSDQSKLGLSLTVCHVVVRGVSEKSFATTNEKIAPFAEQRWDQIQNVEHWSFSPIFRLEFFLSGDDYKLKFTRRERKKYSVVGVFTVQCSRGSALLRTEAWPGDTHAVLRSTSTSLLTTSSSVYCMCVCVCVTVYFILYRLLQIFQKCTLPDKHSSNTVLYCGI